MKRPLTLRRIVLAAGALALGGLLLGVLARALLTGFAVRALLESAGASEIRFAVAQATPWRVEVADLDFRVRTQSFGAKRITLARDHWWSPTLGRVSVEQARVPLNLDGSDTNPWDWATYRNGQVSASPARLPVDEITVDGQLLVQAAALPEQALAVKARARLAGPGRWEVQAEAAGPGLALQAAGSYDLGQDALEFQVTEAALDLQPWQQFVQRLVVLPGGDWELAGRLTGRAQGRWAGSELAVGGEVALADGRVRYARRDVTAEGIEARLDIKDLPRLVTKPGTLRVREIRVGQLTLAALDAEVAFESRERIVVPRLSLAALGGTVAAEPFRYTLSQRVLEAAVTVDGISIEQVMALTRDLPAQATGRVDGRFPIRLDDSGLRLGTGWLALQPGVYAEVQFNATGLLTRGVAPGHPSYAVLKKIESGLLKLKIGELRLDIRPPDAPPGRTAQLHLTGSPVDPDVKAPVILDLNVNGPLEKLLNLGFDSRVSFGTKP
ncbi:MAG: YdbH domain-containing protein [Opitutaceae bacterium]|nr:YdbH domain-containing protein [Opitutaceae bacterium]